MNTLHEFNAAIGDATGGFCQAFALATDAEDARNVLQARGFQPERIHQIGHLPGCLACTGKREG